MFPMCFPSSGYFFLLLLSHYHYHHYIMIIKRERGSEWVSEWRLKKGWQRSVSGKEAVKFLSHPLSTRSEASHTFSIVASYDPRILLRVRLFFLPALPQNGTVQKGNSWVSYKPIISCHPWKPLVGGSRLSSIFRVYAGVGDGWFKHMTRLEFSGVWMRSKLRVTSAVLFCWLYDLFIAC